MFTTVLLAGTLACAAEPGSDAGAPLDGGAEVDAREDCPSLRLQLREELTRIVSCTRDEECGVELDPRCACSVDRVARLDADRSVFDALAARVRASCHERWTSVLDRPCEACHEVVPPGVACIEGTCMHTIEAADCYYDGAPMRVFDQLPATDDLNSCTCYPEAGEVSCTLLVVGR